MPGTRIGAWSVGYRLFSDYEGSPFRLRIDNAGQDEFDSSFTSFGVSDVAAADVLIDGETAYYTKIYNQSGSGPNFIQNTAVRQPIYEQNWVGNFTRSMGFNGSQGLITDAIIPATATWWGYIVSEPTGAGVRELWAVASYPGSATYRLLERVALTGYPLTYNNGEGAFPTLPYDENTAYSILLKGGPSLRYLKSSTNDALSDGLNSSLHGQLSTIGFRNDPGLYFIGNIQEWALFSGTLDTTSEAILWADLNTRWNTPIP